MIGRTSPSTANALRALSVRTTGPEDGPRPHQYTRTVRLDDLAWLQHVNNARLLQMVQEAHISMFYLERVEPGAEIQIQHVYARHELN
jgi:acyl-CoA thioesterase FadM